MYFLLNMGDFSSTSSSFVRELVRACNSTLFVIGPSTDPVLHSFHLFPQVTYLATQKKKGSSQVTQPTGRWKERSRLNCWVELL